MKLKYYLRGLGTGIAVATLIIAISAGRKGSNTMTDEEILARAKELGLVERTVLADMVKNDESEENTEENIEAADKENDSEDTLEETSVEVAEDSEKEDSVEEDSKAEQEPEDNGVVTEITEQTELTGESDAVTDDPEKSGTTDNETEPDANSFGMPDEAGTFTIVVKSGASSDSVSRQLEDAGLVDSASAYDKYLCQNGYDKSIRVGTYEIPADATGEEIAKMITGQ